MPTTPKQFGFIRTTLALWAANVGSFIRAGVVSDSPNGGNAWGVNVPGFGWLYAAMRGAHESFASVAAANLTSGKYPIAGTGGELGDGALSETTDTINVAKRLEAQSPRLTLGAHAVFGGGGPDNAGYVALGRGSDGAQGILIGYLAGVSESLECRFLSTGGGGSWMSWHTRLSSTATEKMRLSSAGGLYVGPSGVNPTAGAITADKGLSAFGVTAPTTRPTVNAAATDLATCIALTNQLRTHLIACGLVQ